MTTHENGDAMTALPLADFTAAEAHASLSDPEFTPLPPPVHVPGTPGRRPSRVVDRDLPFEIDDNGCFVLTKYLNGRGYGVLELYGRCHFAHRSIWLDVVGQIPDGMHLDHLCRNRACVNPDHMEVVTPRVNALRGESQSGRHARRTHCKNGHEFTPETTWWKSDKGARICRICTPARIPRSARPHGTCARYRSGCRCGKCRTAESARNAANYARRTSA